MNGHTHLHNMREILGKLRARQGLTPRQHRDFRQYSNLTYLQQEIQPNVVGHIFTDILQLHNDIRRETVRITEEALQPRNPPPRSPPRSARVTMYLSRQFARTGRSTQTRSSQRGKSPSTRGGGRSKRSRTKSGIRRRSKNIILETI